VVAGGIKLPPGITPYHKVLKTAFALKYQDIQVGTGPEAEPLKVYHVKYTGWLAADGKKFDSSDDHPGKEPIAFPQGRGRVIPGWDQAFDGMKIGGKRRIFIPYQLAYGAAGRPPVIPAKADLIFDIELVDVTDMPAGPPGGRPMPRPGAPGGAAPGSAPGSAPGAPGATPTRPGDAPTTPGSSVEPKKTVVVPSGPPATPPATPAPATSAPAPATPATPPNPQPADQPATPQPQR
jgi:peptidylprolyl isomerase